MRNSAIAQSLSLRPPTNSSAGADALTRQELEHDLAARTELRELRDEITVLQVRGPRRAGRP
jgi:hypothetical protein